MQRKRAVIYCRCSTEEETQVNALSKQIEEAKQAVEANGWILVDQYVELKSGTSTKGRTEYVRLFENLQTDEFDIVVIKSQDRLMRNVKDWYLFLDRMIEGGKKLYIYIEHKFYSTDDSLITGIKAILAEDYSRELSKKINNAHRQRQKNGGKVILTSKTIGYKKLLDGEVVVDEEEAEIIKTIFEYSSLGYGARTIEIFLMNQGRRTKQGNVLSSTSIRRIIRNPLYKGDAIMNKVHYDFETKRNIKNPKEEWIIKKGAVPQIVSEELWESANEQMNLRAERNHQNGSYKKGSQASQYQLSGKLVCGLCGKPYYKRTRRRAGEKVIVWQCSTYLSYGRREKECLDSRRKIEKKFNDGCDNCHIEQKILFQLLQEMSKKYQTIAYEKQEELIQKVVVLLRESLGENNVIQKQKQLEEEKKQIQSQKDKLLEKLLDSVISDEMYKRKNQELEEKEQENKRKQNELEEQQYAMVQLEQRIQKMKQRLENGGVEKATVYQMIDDIGKIIVYPEKLRIYFSPVELFSLKEVGMVMPENLKDKYKEENYIEIEYPYSPYTEEGRERDRKRIVEEMRAYPTITAKQLAEKMERTLPIIRNRIVELREKEIIKFIGKGGHGYWKIY